MGVCAPFFRISGRHWHTVLPVESSLEAVLRSSCFCYIFTSALCSRVFFSAMLVFNLALLVRVDRIAGSSPRNLVNGPRTRPRVS